MSHVTLDEILSQPQTWQETLDSHGSRRQVFRELSDKAENHELIFIGCGTSYYLSMSAASVYSIITRRKARACSASDVLFFPEIIFPSEANGYIPVPISRSGMTTEIVRVSEALRLRLGDLCCCVCCRPDSDLIKLCRYPLILPGSDEQSVVMTRSFTGMLLLIQLLATDIAGNAELIRELSQLPTLGAKIIDRCQPLVEEIISEGPYSNYVYLGQGPYYGLACEAMLKIKEMSLAHSEAYHSLEFRHGPMSIANENTLITFFVCERVRAEEMTLLSEIKALGAKTLVICDRADANIKNLSDYVIEIDSRLSDEARMVLYMPVVQLLGYYSAVSKGHNPDCPKNLSQVVTLA